MYGPRLSEYQYSISRSHGFACILRYFLPLQGLLTDTANPSPSLLFVGFPSRPASFPSRHCFCSSRAHQNFSSSATHILQTNSSTDPLLHSRPTNELYPFLADSFDPSHHTSQSCRLQQLLKVSFLTGLCISSSSFQASAYRRRSKSVTNASALFYSKTDPAMIANVQQSSGLSDQAKPMPQRTSSISPSPYLTSNLPT